MSQIFIQNKKQVDLDVRVKSGKAFCNARITHAHNYSRYYFAHVQIRVQVESPARTVVHSCVQSLIYLVGQKKLVRPLSFIQN